MADALASGASDRKVVWVQVPSPAPYMANEKDDSSKKPAVAGFFVPLTQKIFNAKPKMTFTISGEKQEPYSHIWSILELSEGLSTKESLFLVVE